MSYQTLNFKPGSKYRTRGGFEVQLIEHLPVNTKKRKWRARFLPDSIINPDMYYDKDGYNCNNNRDLDLVELIPEKDI